MEISEAIAGRRTVKPERYTGEEIPDEKVWEILRSANWAPTHGFTEPWRFSVFNGNGKLELLSFLNELDGELHGENTVRNAKRLARFEKTSHLISIGMKRGDNPKIPEIEELLSVAMAVQNMWLTTYSLGLAGYWSTGNLAYRPELKEFIGLKEQDKILGFFYLGVPIKGIPLGTRLTEIEAKVDWR